MQSGRQKAEGYPHSVGNSPSEPLSHSANGEKQIEQIARPLGLLCSYFLEVRGTERR